MKDERIIKTLARERRTETPEERREREAYEHRWRLWFAEIDRRILEPTFLPFWIHLVQK
jgi:hypothetical protein